MSAAPAAAPPVFLVTIKFKRRVVMPQEFTVRLASSDFGDHFTVEKLIQEGYNKWNNTSSTTLGFITDIPRRLLSYGKYIGYKSSNVIVVYTEKDKGRISMTDVARHVLVNNETIVVEYYDRNVVFGVLAVSAA